MPGRRAELPIELTRGPFTRTMALRFGVSLDDLRGPAVQSVDRGVYLDARREITLAVRLAGCLLLLPPDTVVDSVSVLRLYGIDVGPPGPHHFCTTAGHHPRRPGIRVRRVTELPPREGPVSRLVPALVAARIDLELVDLVAAADWVVRLQRAPLATVRAELAAATGRDCRRAHRAAELVRAGVASAQESRLRMLLVLAGLPDPECNVDLGDELFFLACVDLYLRAWNVAVEYEGDHHRTDARQYHRDLGRYEALAAAGVVVVRVSKVAMRRPRDVANRVHRALVAQGYRGPAPVFGREWRQAFEPESPTGASGGNRSR